jgi:ATP-dependent Clp protease ATP-binding subunit ClpC
VQEPPSSRFALDPQRFPALHAVGINLTLAAERGEIEPVVGREDEIERILDVLAKRHANSACLVGRSGVGKTSVVHGIARRIVSGTLASLGDERILVEIPIAELVAGTGVRGALAQRIGALCKEVLASAGRVVLFFDDIHELTSADSSDEGALELKLALARGELTCIGATSVEGYRRAIESDPSLARRFSVVEIEEPTREDAFLILEAVAPRLASHHQVSYGAEALALSIGWTQRYLPSGVLPETPLSVLDLAGARARRRGAGQLTIETVAEVVSELGEVPVERLLESDGDRMLRLEALLAERVVGHVDPLRRIARILRRNAAGLGSRRPIGTFLLLGPTGVGKTETAKAIAHVLFHSDSAITRIDMAEYGEPHSVARLIGSPPGYVGHEAGGQLTEAVRRRAYQVILLDEIEKAHVEVLTAFLGVFDEGRLTDGRGRTVDFTNTVILMTSNIGAEEVGSAARRRVGFGSEDEIDGEIETRLVAAARKRLAPELYNRIDEVIAFAPLTRAEAAEIAGRLLDSLARAMQERHGVRVEVGADAIHVLLESGGFDPSLGVRPLKRAIARLVEAPLAEKILEGDLTGGDTVLVCVDNGQLSLDVLDGPRHAVHPAAE